VGCDMRKGMCAGNYNYCLYNTRSPETFVNERKKHLSVYCCIGNARSEREAITYFMFIGILM
jgi:hypothetical protein